MAEWILAGMRGSQVAAHAAKQDWALSPDDLLDLLDAAHRQLGDDAAIDPAAEASKAVNRLNSLYARSLAIQDYKACLAIQKEINAVVARMSNPLTALAKAPPE